uniref:5'-nucleotidase n=1 Tax=uncultured bacterium Contig1758 TaxID=1393501 RepID=W0FP71_9BACT|nr:acid phosphatase SurE [uncultured bacterium Contig1758]
MKIWVVNDDGIDSDGIKVLARHALKFGEVTVIAPVEQCSGMSQRLTIGLFENGKVKRKIKKVPFPVEGVKEAYAVEGTPTDCVIVASEYIAEKPDIVFSGINHGENAGIDILYSGTIGAAMEALVQRIPAIAFSLKWEATGYELVDQELGGIMETLLEKKLPRNKIWNVNFPANKPDTYKGILWDRVPSQRRYGNCQQDPEDVINSDRVALDQGYISIGTVTNMALVP